MFHRPVKSIVFPLVVAFFSPGGGSLLLQRLPHRLPRTGFSHAEDYQRSMDLARAKVPQYRRVGLPRLGRAKRLPTLQKRGETAKR